MVFLASTELKQKMNGYRLAAEKFDKKIEKLNNEQLIIEEKILKNIAKKEAVIAKIEQIIKKLEKNMQSEDVQDEVLTLMALRKSFENDISYYNGLTHEKIVPIGKILNTSGIEGVTQATRLLE